jgi:hypothetical protein
MQNGTLGITQQNAEKSLVLASALFPNEEWIIKEHNIWVGKSRVKNTPKERAKFAWEIEQIRPFITNESVVYFLPEIGDSVLHGKLSADTVINGEIVEIKAVTGSRATLGTEFRKGYKQGSYLCARLPQIKTHSVFIRLFSNLSVGSVKAKIAGELKNRVDNGRFICCFDTSGTLFSWSFDELRGIIGSKTSRG